MLSEFLGFPQRKFRRRKMKGGQECSVPESYEKNAPPLVLPVCVQCACAHAWVLCVHVCVCMGVCAYVQSCAMCLGLGERAANRSVRDRRVVLGYVM